MLSPPLTLNHCWDNKGPPPTHPTTFAILLPFPDPQTDTSFIEILWCSNPQLPPGVIMDSLRQPFPARLSSKLAWVISPPLLLEEKTPQQCQSCHNWLFHRLQRASSLLTSWTSFTLQSFWSQLFCCSPWVSLDTDLWHCFFLKIYWILAFFHLFFNSKLILSSFATPMNSEASPCCPTVKQRG